MIRHHPRDTHDYKLLPYTTLCHSGPLPLQPVAESGLHLVLRRRRRQPDARSRCRAHVPQISVLRTRDRAVIARSVATKQSSALLNQGSLLDCFAALALTGRDFSPAIGAPSGGVPSADRKSTRLNSSH